MPPTALHPAVAVAREAFGVRLHVEVVATLVRDDVVAVLLESADGRYASLVEHRDGAWVAPGYLAGHQLARVSRTSHTEIYDPLPQMVCTESMWPDAGRKPTTTWFAMTALAGLDAVMVETSCRLDECHEPIRSDGLVFHMLRVPTGMWPEITVTTVDGRRLSVHRDKRAYN